MGNSIESYRAAIGLFYLKKRNLYRPTDFRADTYQDILLTNLRCTFLVVSLFILQSIHPKIDIVFLLFVLQYILIIGNVELNPGPETYSLSSAPVDNSVISDEKSISICNINIRSVRNKLDFLRHFADEFDILAITESHLDANVRDEDLEIDVFGKSFLRKDRNNSGGGLLIYFKSDVVFQRKLALENDVDETI